MKTIATFTLILSASLLSATPDNTLSLTITDLKTPTCNGNSDGSVSVQATGGKAPYHYSWNTFPQQDGPQAINLCTGVYFVEIRDAAGNIFFQSIHVPDPIETQLTYVDSNAQLYVSCNAPITYIVTLNNLPFGDNNSANLQAGIYKLVIESNQCTVVQYLSVIELHSEDETSVQTELVSSHLFVPEPFTTSSGLTLLSTP